MENLKTKLERVLAAAYIIGMEIESCSQLAGNACNKPARYDTRKAKAAMWQAQSSLRSAIFALGDDPDDILNGVKRKDIKP